MAGSFRDFAKQKDIFTFCAGAANGAATHFLPFNYKEAVLGHKSTQNVALQSNDTLVVP